MTSTVIDPSRTANSVAVASPERVFERAQVAVGEHDVRLSKNGDERKKQSDAQELENGGEQHQAKDGQSLPLLPG